MTRRNPIIKAIDKTWKKVVPDFVVGKDCLRIQVGDNVICGKDGIGYYGIGVVKKVFPADQLATVRLYPWLSPGWDGETYVFPASWLELDLDYEKRRGRR